MFRFEFRASWMSSRIQLINENEPLKYFMLKISRFLTDKRGCKPQSTLVRKGRLGFLPPLWHYYALTFPPSLISQKPRELRHKIFYWFPLLFPFKIKAIQTVLMWLTAWKKGCSLLMTKWTLISGKGHICRKKNHKIGYSEGSIYQGSSI